MEVDQAYDGEEALELALNNKYDIILLDVMLPKLTGFEVCQKIRECSKVPIIMLTAKNDDSDKIAGLEYGADDYVTKPFNIQEVKARIKAIMRRLDNEDNNKSAAADKNTLIIKDLRMESHNKRLFIDGNEVSVTVKEYEVLELLAKNPGTVYSRDELLELIWGVNYPGGARTVDVHIRRLREKIEPDPSYPKYVQTKWGVGYYFKG